MNRPIFILGIIVSVVCQLKVALAVNPTLDGKFVQEDDSSEGLSGQLRLISPILVNPDEFLNRGKSYTAYCPTVDPPGTRADFFTAFRSCMNHGQQMARDQSLNDSKNLAKIVSTVGEKVWIGGTDLGKPGSWIWLASLQRIGLINNYLNWKQGEPGTSGNCMAAKILHTGEVRWVTNSCYDDLCYVCEKTLT